MQSAALLLEGLDPIQRQTENSQAVWFLKSKVSILIGTRLVVPGIRHRTRSGTVSKGRGQLLMGEPALPPLLRVLTSALGGILQQNWGLLGEF